VWWKGVKVLGIASAVLLTLAFLFILIMVTRPALLVGVSGDDLAHSLANTTSPSGGSNCRKAEDGDWVCNFAPPGGLWTRYEVTVDWLGCWEAGLPGTDSSASGTAGSRYYKSGCIELGDVIRIESD
jgi:hypothetical protein